MTERVLVIAVHPDDETLGCGGTLLRLSAEGAELHWLIVSGMSAEGGYSRNEIEKRDVEIQRVAAGFGFTTVTKLEHPARRIDEVPLSQLVAQISKTFDQIKPNQVFLPYHHDPHSDHRHTFAAAYSCTKNFRYPFIKRVLMMEVLSETDFAQSADGGFTPNVFVNITDYFDTKIQLMSIYESEISQHPFPRSKTTLTALATLRGAAAGCMYAESFMLLKDII
jgi:LmbE family N-acetylglucosaminyl deacetylase